MKELKLKGDKTTPEVVLNPTGLIKIKGRSIHENIRDFFKPVELWVEEYIKNDPAEITNIDISLEYFNSTTAKVLISILQKLMKVQLKNKKLIINWYYEEGDDDIQEKGEYFSSILKIPFNFRQLN
jgi:SiaC family regulatory phosphoprotein